MNFDNLENLPLAAIITGKATFISPHIVNVKLLGDNQEITITASNIFINTGSQPFVPAIEGIQSSKKVFTSTTLMEQPGLLQKLVIIGAGFIGLEFADMYARFGSEVTMLDSEDTFLPKEDKDMADEIFKVLTGKNINIINGVSVQTITDTGNNGVLI